MTELTCHKTDCINRELYTDCYLIGSEYCKFYERLIKTRFTNPRGTMSINLILSPNGSLETKVEKRER